MQISRTGAAAGAVSAACDDRDPGRKAKLPCARLRHAPDNVTAAVQRRQFFHVDAELPEQLRLIAARRDVHQLAVAGVGVIRRIGISGQPGNDVILRLKEFFGFFIDLRAALPEPEDLAERAARIQNVAGHLIQALRADIAADLRILRRGS